MSIVLINFMVRYEIGKNLVPDYKKALLMINRQIKAKNSKRKEMH